MLAAIRTSPCACLCLVPSVLIHLSCTFCRLLSLTIGDRLDSIHEAYSGMLDMVRAMDEDAAVDVVDVDVDMVDVDVDMDGEADAFSERSGV